MPNDSSTGPEARAIMPTLPTATGGVVSGGMLTRVLETAVKTVKEHWLYLALLAVYGLASLVAAAQHGAAGHLRLSLYKDASIVILISFLVLFFFGHAGYWAIIRRPDNPSRAMVEDLWNNFFTAERIFAGLIVVLTIPSLISIFTTMKVLIPVIHPFGLDPTFAALDRWLHFGIDPWRLLQPVFGNPAATTAINFLYHLWLFLVFFVLFWQAFSTSRRRLRLRFLISFVLCWTVLGTFFATLLSSAGPVYYQQVVGVDGGFVALLDYLHAANETSPVWALDVHQMLWTNYRSGSIDVGTGISAMPSLHVAMVCLFIPVCWQTNKWLGIAAIVYAAAILIGSVHLAWHYAIDGYFAIVVTWVIWRLSGWLVPARASD